MRVKFQQEPKDFKPINLTITLESEQELKTLTDMCAAPYGISEVIYLGEAQRDRVVGLLGAIRKVLDDNIN